MLPNTSLFLELLCHKLKKLITHFIPIEEARAEKEYFGGRRVRLEKGLEFGDLLENFGGNGPKSNGVKRRNSVWVIEATQWQADMEIYPEWTTPQPMILILQPTIHCYACTRRNLILKSVKRETKLEMADTQA
ncbi:hypothetical protein Tco_0674381 [Tanacetum coccineum]